MNFFKVNLCKEMLLNGLVLALGLFLKNKLSVVWVISQKKEIYESTSFKRCIKILKECIKSCKTEG